MPQRKRRSGRKRYSSPDMNFHMPRVTKSLEACWPLRHSGAALFASDGDSGLSPINTPTFSWQGAHFTAASSQYLQEVVADKWSGDSAGAVMAWIKRDTIGRAHVIFGSSDTDTSNFRFLFEVFSDNFLYVVTSVAGTTAIVRGSTVIPKDEWHHVALTSNSSAYAIYLDGQSETLVASGAGNTGNWFADISNRDNITVGAEVYSVLNAPFDGTIRDARIFSRAPSAGEVIACMHPTT